MWRWLLDFQNRQNTKKSWAEKTIPARYRYIFCMSTFRWQINSLDLTPDNPYESVEIYKKWLPGGVLFSFKTPCSKKHILLFKALQFSYFYRAEVYLWRHRSVTLQLSIPGAFWAIAENSVRRPQPPLPRPGRLNPRPAGVFGRTRPAALGGGQILPPV